ncbi:MAG: AAA family ATPase [Deltaproteobacteria bacterium]|nr:AAA family ATPase [Deltaproteobacteria bacterium]
MENIRCFHDLEIDLRQGVETPNLLTLIIGKNGTCKTTLLRAIVIGLCDQVDAYPLLSEPIGKLVTEGAAKAVIEIDLISLKDSKKYTITTEIEQVRGKEFIKEQNYPRLPERVFLCGYGAGRSSLEGPEMGGPYAIRDSAYTLFNYGQPLFSPELTLRRLKDYLKTENRYQKVLSTIKRVLGLSPEVKFNFPEGGGVELSGPSIGKHIALQGWADGYRVAFNWMLDVYGWAMRAKKLTPTGEIRGIVLIDQLEQHLHPSLQMEMPRRLKKAFPEVQFFATSHSPNIILGALPHEVVSLYRKNDIVHKEEIPDFSGYSAEDIQIDKRLFDTGAYSPETNKKLERYHQLAAIPKDKRTQEQTDELRLLAKELRSQQIPEVRESESIKELKKLLEKHGL